MDTLSLEPLAPEASRAQAGLKAHTGRLQWAALAAILALAAALRLANLGALGYVNHYYTAGIASMLQSWRNFFFVAAEPGGSVSIDKPPLGLWVQAVSAYFLGVNGVAMVLPEILAGLASIAVLFHLVRRSFGGWAGLLAALALAVTPIVVATDRNNTIDSQLILILLLAAWAFIKAAEAGRLRYLLLGAVCVGLGFNIKMLQAFLPLPALYALYLSGSSEGLRRKVFNLLLASGLLLVVAFAWVTAVELTPADQRPYVGSSGDNSMWSLIFGYNGLERLTGMGRGSPADGRRFSGPGGQPGSPPAGPGAPLPQFGAGRPQPFGGGGGAFPGTGEPGLLRLLVAPLSKEASWLFPIGILGAALLAVGSRLRWPLAAEHQALVLWGGWLGTGAVFFSIARFFHEYYLSMLAPPLAALVGIGVGLAWGQRSRSPWLAAGWLLAAGAVTLAYQAFTAAAYGVIAWWLPLAAVALMVGGGLWAVTAARPRANAAGAGAALVVAAIFLTPGVWSALTTLNASDNQSLPAAYGGQASGPANRGGLQINSALMDFLAAHTQGVEYLMAVPSSMQGSDYVIASQRPVLYLGGFSGQDRVVTVQDLARLVADGRLRYIYWSAEGAGLGGPGGPGRGDISTWVAGACRPVTGFDTATVSAGAPDGAQGGLGNGGIPFRVGRAAQLTLYACGP